MERKTIEYEELEFSDSPDGLPVKYKGKLFSGTAIEENEKNYFEYKYRNGVQDGRSFGIDKKSEKLILQEFFKNGIAIGEHFNIFPSKEIHINELYDKGNLIKKTVHSFDNLLLLEFDKINDTEIEYNDEGKIIKKE